MKVWAIISLQIEGIHKYPNAPKEVEFLRYPHRHLFKIIVFIEQKHTDRDVEYIMTKRWLEKVIPRGDLGEMSCENLAKRILDIVKERFPDRKIKVIVLEDGENGALIEE